MIDPHIENIHWAGNGTTLDPVGRGVGLLQMPAGCIGNKRTVPEIIAIGEIGIPHGIIKLLWAPIWNSCTCARVARVATNKKKINTIRFIGCRFWADIYNCKYTHFFELCKNIFPPFEAFFHGRETTIPTTLDI